MTQWVDHVESESTNGRFLSFFFPSLSLFQINKLNLRMKSSKRMVRLATSEIRSPLAIAHAISGSPRLDLQFGLQAWCMAEGSGGTRWLWEGGSVVSAEPLDHRQVLWVHWASASAIPVSMEGLNERMHRRNSTYYNITIIIITTWLGSGEASELMGTAEAKILTSSCLGLLFAVFFF